MASVACLLVVLFPVSTAWGGDSSQKEFRSTLEHSSLSALQHHLELIDQEIGRQATMSLRSGIGAIGYRSERSQDPDHSEWIQVRFAEQSEIDQVVLVPTIWRDGQAGFRADGFPIAFHLMVGDGNETQGSIVARFGPEDGFLPRLAPMVVDCPPGTKGSWVRLVATSLGPRLWDGRQDLQLSEIMVFSGEENIALHAEVDVSSTDRETPSIHKRFLVDGHLPYLMDAKYGEKSIAFVSPVSSEKRAQLVIDLESTQFIDRVHLHAVDTSDTAPQSTGTDFGVPRELVLIGSNHSDLAEAKTLCTIRVGSIYESGPIMMKRFEATACRYVAMIAEKPFIQSGDSSGRSQIGFAEIELFAHGRNVALHKPVTANFRHRRRGRSLEALTDGRNFYGDILPIREWLNQLGRRHQLEAMRPVVSAELRSRYASQTSQLRLARWLIASSVIIIGFLLVGTRYHRARQLAQVKERFAADLHDELGANLHSIGLLSDLARDAKQVPEELSDHLQRIRDLTEKTGIAMRHLVETREPTELYTDFKSDMQEAAERIAVNVDHEIEVVGDQYLNELGPSTRVGLLLFYKECLVNISRHAGATQLQTRLVGTNSEIELYVCDNGCGMAAAAGLRVAPPSLSRRARLLGATITVETPNAHGTSIRLRLRTRRFGIWKRRELL